MAIQSGNVGGKEKDVRCRRNVNVTMHLPSQELAGYETSKSGQQNGKTKPHIEIHLNEIMPEFYKKNLRSSYGAESLNITLNLTCYFSGASAVIICLAIMNNLFSSVYTCWVFVRVVQ